MLRITQFKSAAAAKRYFDDGLHRQDYYARDNEIGIWGGKTAERLGLSGEVSKEHFHQLMDNRNPLTGDALTPRTRSDRTAMYDYTFNAPKSFSILHAFAKGEEQEKLDQALTAAVDATMQELEKDMQVRVRKGGVYENRNTGNLVYARFMHTKTRPIDGVPDMSSHVHVTVANVSYDEQENIYKAGQFRQMHQNAPYYESIFHNHLARNVQELGYQVERTGAALAYSKEMRSRDAGTFSTWKVKGISQESVKEFSRRTQQVHEEASSLSEKLGQLGDRLLSALGAKTRESKKGIHLNEEQIMANWQSRLPKQDADNWPLLKDQERTHTKGAREAVAYAMEHHFERRSTIDEKRFLATAISYAVGNTSIDELKLEMKQAGILQVTNAYGTSVTAAHVLAEEKEMIKTVKEQQGKYRRLGQEEYAFQSPLLSPEQQQAVKAVLSSRAGVIALQGSAGVGKTTLMHEVKAATENNPEGARPLHAFIPTSEGKAMLERDGFKGAKTVAQLLNDQETQASIRNGIVWIDEASQLSVPDMVKILHQAKEHNARVILTGDQFQHNSVERGDAFRLLGQYSGIPLHKVSKIQRQADPRYRQAVQELASGNTEAGLQLLDKMKAIVEEKDDGARYERMAKDYVASVSNGLSTLVVSPTHRENALVTEAIRSALREKGMIDADYREVTVLKNRNLTRAEKSDATRYQAGEIIKPVKNLSGMRLGESYSVISTKDATTLLLARKDGSRIELDVRQAKHFNVFDTENVRVAKGEKIRITMNGTTTDGRHRLNNGSYYTVDGFTDNGDLRLSSGQVVSRDFGHLQYGYSSTSYSSQGKTLDTVLIAQSSASFGQASTREQFYVSASRGKERIQVYTDDKKELVNQVAKSSQRESAHELTAREQRYYLSDLHRRFKQYTESITRTARKWVDRIGGHSPDFSPSRG